MSLAFQVFAGCITGYQLLLEARDMPERFEYLRIRLQLEQYRLLDWAIAANLATDAYSISSEAHPSHKATMDVLSQIHALLSNLESISKCYKLTLCADNTDRRIAPLTGLANDAWEPQVSQHQHGTDSVHSLPTLGTLELTPFTFPPSAPPEKICSEEHLQLHITSQPSISRKGSDGQFFTPSSSNSWCPSWPS